MSSYVDENLRGANDSTNNKTKAVKKRISPKAERNLAGLFYFFGGLIGSFLCFEFAYWVMSNFEVHYVIKSIVALIFSVLVIKAWDKATGEIPTLMSGPITFFTIIIFALSLFIGYSHANGRSANSLEGLLLGADKVTYVKPVKDDVADSKKGTIDHIGKVWKTSKIYNAGDNVHIIISGSSVRVMNEDSNGDLLSPGEYYIPITSRGNLAFVGIGNNTSVIEVLN